MDETSKNVLSFTAVSTHAERTHKLPINVHCIAAFPISPNMKHTPLISDRLQARPTRSTVQTTNNVATSIKTCFHFAAIWAARARAHWPQSQTARSDKMKKKNSFPISLIYEALRSFCIMCTATLSHIKARAYTTRGRYSIQHTFIYCVRSDKSVLWRRKSIDLEARTSERKTHQVSICMLIQCIPIDDESRIDVINVMQP